MHAASASQPRRRQLDTSLNIEVIVDFEKWLLKRGLPRLCVLPRFRRNISPRREIIIINNNKSNFENKPKVQIINPKHFQCFLSMKKEKLPQDTRKHTKNSQRNKGEGVSSGIRIFCGSLRLDRISARKKKMSRASVSMSSGFVEFLLGK